ncbi:sigma-70 family RNA polymerase sigma factor [Paracoccus litorisediminis]|uniref:sigma-70 family RNA polymerase sigma factor n=1 Tax=Paracoccus litorisediminis TaxID=2006130 RepID=UPI00373021A3
MTKSGRETAKTYPVPRRANEAMLTREEECRLARAWRDEGDVTSRNRLVESHRAFAIKHARKFMGTGVDVEDLSQEAVIGLMKAADRFDPDLGWLFSTYALWWVKASLRDYAITNHSIVRIPNGIYRKMFFSLRKTYEIVANQLRASGEAGDPLQVRMMAAEKLGIPLSDIERFEGGILQKDASLHAKIGDEEGSSEWIDMIRDDSANTEAIFIRDETEEMRGAAIAEALDLLTDREKKIVIRRRLSEDDNATLEVLGQEMGVTKERIRQIEIIAFKKMKRHILSKYGKKSLID